MAEMLPYSGSRQRARLALEAITFRGKRSLTDASLTAFGHLFPLRGKKLPSKSTNILNDCWNEILQAEPKLALETQLDAYRSRIYGTKKASRFARQIFNASLEILTSRSKEDAEVWK